MHIRMNELTNEGAGVLAGAIPGRKAFTKLLEQAAEYEPNSPDRCSWILPKSMLLPRASCENAFLPFVTDKIPPVQPLSGHRERQ